MHHLWKHSKSGIYYVMHGPRFQKRVSTGTRDIGKAEAFLAQFIAGERSPVIEQPTVGEILAGYEDDKKDRVRGRDGLKYGVRALTRALGQLQPNNLTPPVIRDYADKRGASAGTILRDIGVLRAALKWALEHQWIKAADIPIISNPRKTPRPRDRWITRDEAWRLIEECREPHIKGFVVLGCMTLARSGAILDARWSRVDLERRLIDYGEGHGNKRRVVAKLNDEAHAVLAALRELACTDHVIERHGKPLSSIRKGFREACRRAGLKGVTPHILRHSGATWLAMDGMPMREIARLMGDDEATVERVYAKHSPDYLKRTTDALRLNPTGALLRGQSGNENALP